MHLYGLKKTASLSWLFTIKPIRRTVSYLGRHHWGWQVVCLYLWSLYTWLTWLEVLPSPLVSVVEGSMSGLSSVNLQVFKLWGAMIKGSNSIASLAWTENQSVRSSPHEYVVIHFVMIYLYVLNTLWKKIGFSEGTVYAHRQIAGSNFAPSLAKHTSLRNVAMRNYISFYHSEKGNITWWIDIGSANFYPQAGW